MKRIFLVIGICAFFTSVAAYGGTPVRSIGFDVGYVNPDLEDVDGTWTAGVFMDFGLGTSNVQLSPFINYWTLSNEYLATDGFELYNVSESLRDISLGLNLRYAFPTTSTAFQPFIAGGLAVHMANASIEIQSSTAYGEADDSETELGFQGGLGFRTGISPNAGIVASAWYNVLEIEDFEVDHWSFRAGLAWNI